MLDCIRELHKPETLTFHAGAIHNDFLKDGFKLLPEQKVDKMHDYFWDRKPEIDKTTYYYPQKMVVNCPGVLEMANKFLKDAQRYLGVTPIIANYSTWWSHPGESEHERLWHTDLDDIRFLKLFVYLTDVNEASGPHMSIPGSQDLNLLHGLSKATATFAPWYFSTLRKDDLVVSMFFHKLKRILFTGERGTAFLNDTRGLHRGVTPVAASRLVLQVLYTVAPFYHEEPAKITRRLPKKYDPYSNMLWMK
jgi:hypothetical protein